MKTLILAITIALFATPANARGSGGGAGGDGGDGGSAKQVGTIKSKNSNEIKKSGNSVAVGLAGADASTAVNIGGNNFITPEETERRIKETLDGYLLDHESDIAWEVNDFGELKDWFVSVFSRQPSKDLT